MSLTISEGGSTDFPKLEKGIYQGTCFRIVDLGTSDQTYGKEVSKKPDCVLRLRLQMP